MILELLKPLFGELTSPLLRLACAHLRRITHVNRLFETARVVSATPMFTTPFDELLGLGITPSSACDPPRLNYEPRATQRTIEKDLLSLLASPIDAVHVRMLGHQLEGSLVGRALGQSVFRALVDARDSNDWQFRLRQRVALLAATQGTEQRRGLLQSLEEFLFRNHQLLHMRPRLVVVHADSGYGKSYLVQRLYAQSLARRTHWPIVIDCEGTHYGRSLHDALCSSGSPALWPTVESLIEQHSVVQQRRELQIFIDGPDAHSNPRELVDELVRLLSSSRHLPIRILVTCRSSFWTHFRDRLGAPDWHSADHCFKLEPMRMEEVSACLSEHCRAHRIDPNRIIGPALEKCRHPQWIRYICESMSEGFDGTTSVVGSVRVDRIVETCIDSRFQSSRFARFMISSDLARSTCSMLAREVCNKLEQVIDVKYLRQRTGRMMQQEMATIEALHRGASLLSTHSIVGAVSHVRFTDNVVEDYFVARCLLGEYWNSTTGGRYAKHVANVVSRHQRVLERFPGATEYVVARALALRAPIDSVLASLSQHANLPIFVILGGVNWEQEGVADWLFRLIDSEKLYGHEEQAGRALAASPTTTAFLLDLCLDQRSGVSLTESIRVSLLAHLLANGRINAENAHRILSAYASDKGYKDLRAVVRRAVTTVSEVCWHQEVLESVGRPLSIICNGIAEFNIFDGIEVLRLLALNRAPLAEQVFNIVAGSLAWDRQLDLDVLIRCRIRLVVILLALSWSDRCELGAISLRKLVMQLSEASRADVFHSQ